MLCDDKQAYVTSREMAVVTELTEKELINKLAKKLHKRYDKHGGVDFSRFWQKANFESGYCQSVVFTEEGFKFCLEWLERTDCEKANNAIAIFEELQTNYKNAGYAEREEYAKELLSNKRDSKIESRNTEDLKDCSVDVIITAANKKIGLDATDLTCQFSEKNITERVPFTFTYEDLEEFYRITKPGGKIVVGFPADNLRYLNIVDAFNYSGFKIASAPFFHVAPFDKAKVLKPHITEINGRVYSTLDSMPNAVTMFLVASKPIAEYNLSKTVSEGICLDKFFRKPNKNNLLYQVNSKELFEENLAWRIPNNFIFSASAVSEGQGLFNVTSWLSESPYKFIAKVLESDEDMLKEALAFFMVLFGEEDSVYFDPYLSKASLDAARIVQRTFWYSKRETSKLFYNDFIR